MTTNSATLSLPEGDANTDDYVRVDRVIGSTVLPRRLKPSALVVTPTGGSARTLAAIGADVDSVTGRVAAASVGTVTTAATTVATEYTTGVDHTTLLTMTGFVIGTIVESSSLGIGAKFYTLPAGAIQVENATWSGFVVGSGTTKTATPEIGIGTVIASGAIATLSTTFENVMDGGATSGAASADAVTVAPDINSTVFNKVSLTTVNPVIKASGGAARDLFLNAAAAWTATSNGTLTATGVLTIKWRKLN